MLGWLRAVWLWPAAAALAVTGVGIGSAQPWRDELATWSAATRPLGDLTRMAGTIDAATWPYYLSMHGWVALCGDSPAALRLPSALAMAGTAGLTATLGARLLGRRAGLAGGLLFAVLPGTSRYAQEARPYAFVALFAVLATLLLVRALERPGWRRWAGYAAAVAALGLAHLVALTLLAAHAAVVLAADRSARNATRPTVNRDASDTTSGTTDGDPPGVPGPAARRAGGPAGLPRLAGRWPRRASWGWLLALLPATVVLTPLVLLAAGQRGRQLDWVDPARPADLAALPGALAQSGAVGGLLLGLAALGVARSGRAGLLPAACLVLPVTLVFLAGLAGPLWVPRYLFFAVPFACLLAGAALATVALPAALAVVLLAGLLGLPDQVALRRSHEWPRGALVDYRGAARVVDAGRRPGDVIVFSPRDGWLFTDLGIGYHLGDRQPPDALAVRGRDARGDYWTDECPAPAACLAGARRVWLVVAGRQADPADAVPGAKGTALRDGFAVERVWQRPGLTVALLTR
ncbi:glycosyltransferase family 39 protein [Micromonospora sp. WMMD712]|uniref:glycosyltransferase family 39 protein n=1 Tax=Micromonospora sp. WMMD712 TaxID=3016096 RepID=UPI00249A70DF|nr:glycosyltransferase family 39 protein [Micromonospora sp. WMMD712]WFE61566.1 glycosyltransferase family 39 protein [Micromonospora sp. WMMD712]